MKKPANEMTMPPVVAIASTGCSFGKNVNEGRISSMTKHSAASQSPSELTRRQLKAWHMFVSLGDS
jgi:hypothetical protein